MLKEGDIIELKEGHVVYFDIPERLIYVNRKDSSELAHAEVEIGGAYRYLAGRYVVYKTSLDGGFNGQGFGDIYPDGHRVFCERMDDRSVKVDFYQTGCFTAKIEDIEPVGSIDDNKSTSGFADGTGTFDTITMDYRPELAKFKQEVVNRLRDSLHGDSYGKIESLITWIERGTD